MVSRTINEDDSWKSVPKLVHVRDGRGVRDHGSDILRVGLLNRYPADEAKCARTRYRAAGLS